MSRLPSASQPLKQVFSRSIHSSSQSLAPGDRPLGSFSYNNRNSANVSTPASPNRFQRTGQGQSSRYSPGDRPRGSMSRPIGKVRDATNKYRASFANLNQIPLSLQYYSPSFLNLEEHVSNKKAPRKFPTLGPPAAIAKKIDPLYQLKLRPGHPSLHDDSYKNPTLLSQYVSEMGKIQSRRNTQLTRRSQREIGKAIRRARSMGLMPVMTRTPMVWNRFGVR